MRTLSQRSINDLVFGRLILIIVIQFLLFVLSFVYNFINIIELDMATLVNIAAVMTCVAMLSSARTGFSSIFQNIVLLIFDTFYLAILLGISGGFCSPFLILLPLYIFFSSLTLANVGTITSTLFSVIIILYTSLLNIKYVCNMNIAFVIASTMVLFALLCSYVIRKKDCSNISTEKTKILDDVVSVLAHEIKNPVSSLSGVAELIRTDDKILNSEEQKNKLLGIIERETNRLSKLTEEFLIYSGSEKRRNEKIELLTLLSSACDNIKIQKDFISKNLTLKLETEETTILMYGDYNRLEQAFNNILINAVHASKTNGVIKCSVSKGFADFIVVISNNGEKIPEAALNRIFTPFFTTKDKGTGLGLAIASNIIKAHDGDIMVISSDEETSFTIIFKTRREF